MTVALAQPQLVIGDADALERRARALAEPAAAEDGTVGALRVVAFHLGGAACAVDADVLERALVALARPFAVPLASGEQRVVAFVDERPVAVVDLAGIVGDGPRPAASLDGRPALVLRTGGGLVAVVVDGPLELAEERVVASVGAAEADAGGAIVRLAGRLAGGAALVDGSWLATWAWKAATA